MNLTAAHPAGRRKRSYCHVGTKEAKSIIEKKFKLSSEMDYHGNLHNSAIAELAVAVETLWRLPPKLDANPQSKSGAVSLSIDLNHALSYASRHRKHDFNASLMSIVSISLGTTFHAQNRPKRCSVGRCLRTRNGFISSSTQQSRLQCKHGFPSATATVIWLRERDQRAQGAHKAYLEDDSATADEVEIPGTCTDSYRNANQPVTP